MEAKGDRPRHGSCDSIACNNSVVGGLVTFHAIRDMRKRETLREGQTYYIDEAQEGYMYCSLLFFLPPLF
jgi:hypothetical protein